MKLNSFAISSQAREFYQVYIGAKLGERILRALVNQKRGRLEEEIPFHEKHVHQILIKTSNYCENLVFFQSNQEEACGQN